MEVFYNQVVKTVTVTVNQKVTVLLLKFNFKKGSIYNERIRKNNRIN